jgi:hypothetical protein
MLYLSTSFCTGKLSELKPTHLVRLLQALAGGHYAQQDTLAKQASGCAAWLALAWSELGRLIVCILCLLGVLRSWPGGACLVYFVCAWLSLFVELARGYPSLHSIPADSGSLVELPHSFFSAGLGISC